MSLVLTEKRKEGESGYFRLGVVTLQIPPEDILTNKVVNNTEITPLRAPYPLLQKTGHARWDATIRFRSLVDWSTGEADYQQWDDLRYVVAMFKAAPFVEVENGHLRQILTQDNPSLKKYKIS